MRRDVWTAGAPAHALGGGSQLQRQQVVPDDPPVTAVEPAGEGRVHLLRPVLPAVRSVHARLGRLAGLGDRPASADPGMDRAAGLVAPLLELVLAASHEPRPADA